MYAPPSYLIILSVNIDIFLVRTIIFTLVSYYTYDPLVIHPHGNSVLLFFAASNPGSTISTLLLELVWKSPPWVLQQTNLVIFFRIFLHVFS